MCIGHAYEGWQKVSKHLRGLWNLPGLVDARLSSINRNEVLLLL